MVDRILRFVNVGGGKVELQDFGPAGSEPSAVGTPIKLGGELSINGAPIKLDGDSDLDVFGLPAANEEFSLDDLNLPSLVFPEEDIDTTDSFISSLESFFPDNI